MVLVEMLGGKEIPKEVKLPPPWLVLKWLLYSSEASPCTPLVSPGGLSVSAGHCEATGLFLLAETSNLPFPLGSHMPTTGIKADKQGPQKPSFLLLSPADHSPY